MCKNKHRIGVSLAFEFHHLWSLSGGCRNKLRSTRHSAMYCIDSYNNLTQGEEITKTEQETIVLLATFGERGLPWKKSLNAIPQRKLPTISRNSLLTKNPTQEQSQTQFPINEGGEIIPAWLNFKLIGDSWMKSALSLNNRQCLSRVMSPVVLDCIQSHGALETSSFRAESGRNCFTGFRNFIPFWANNQ